VLPPIAPLGAPGAAPVAPPVMPPLLLSLSDGAAEEPDPGGQAVLPAPDVLFMAVLLPAVELRVAALPVTLLQSLSRLELPRVAALPELVLGALIEPLPVTPLVPLLEDCA
jgi:hypothetical protein